MAIYLQRRFMQILISLLEEIKWQGLLLIYLEIVVGNIVV
jgi:hypothetical protein